MKHKFNILSEEIAVAAVEEGKKLGLNPVCEKVDDVYEISYASCYEEKPACAEPMSREEVYSCVQSMWDGLRYELKYMREDVSSLWKAFYEHKSGHLPKISDAGKMEAALKALGIADSYQVHKPTVWVEY